MPDSPYGPGAQATVEDAIGTAESEMLNAANLGAVNQAKGLFNAAQQTGKMGAKLNELSEEQSDDFIVNIENFSPAGDLADLLDSVPFSGGIGLGALADVLGDVQEAVDEIVKNARFSAPWDDVGGEPPPPIPPAPQNPSDTSSLSPWGDGGKGGPDSFTSPLKDPLILDLDGGGVEFLSVAESNAYFDFDGDSFAEKTGWIGAGEGFLVLDANTNGSIDDISEMFGDEQTNGFDELAAYDSNTDGSITSADTAFSSLKVWQDLDGDGETDSGELQTLGYYGITAINLAADDAGYMAEGNFVDRVGTFTIASSTEEVVTAWFANDELLTRYIPPGNFTFDPDALVLPDLQGYGNLPNLRVAMTGDAVLLGMVQDLVNGAADVSYTEFREGFEAVIKQWSGVSGVTPGSRGGYVDAEQLEILEEFYGTSFPGNPTQRAGSGLSTTYDEMIDYMGQSFVSQLAYYDALQHVNSPEDSLVNPFWGLAAAGFDGSVVTASPDFEEIIHQLSFEQRINHDDGPLTFIARTAPWLEAFKDAIYNGDAEAFSAALKYYIHEEFTDNAIKVTVHDAATGKTVIEVGEGESLVGTGGDDLLIIAQADAAVRGGDGNDTYAIGRGVHAEIIDIEPGLYTHTDADVVVFEGRLLASASFSRWGSDLLVTFADAPDSSVLVGSVGNIEHFVFQDQALDLADVVALALASATEGDDILERGSGDDELDGGVGDDLLIGGEDSDTYQFDLGSGRDIVVEDHDGGVSDVVRFGAGIASIDLTFEHAGSDLVIRIDGEPDLLTIRDFFEQDTVEEFVFDDTSSLSATTVAGLAVGEGDLIDGTSDEDLLESGADNDLLTGGDGGDTYVYELGDGFDTLDDHSSIYTDFPDSEDVLVLDGISIENVKFSRPDLNHIIIDIFGPMPGRIKIENVRLDADTFNGRIETFVLDDATLSYRDVELMLLDSVRTDADDYIVGFDADDTFLNSLGNDVFDGYGGIDTFVWSAGDGRDVVRGVSDATLVLHGVSAEDILVRAPLSDPDSVMLLVEGSHAQAVVIASQDFETVSRIVFDDGVIWDSSELLLRMRGPFSQVATHPGTSGEETVTGSSEDDVLVGGQGDDTLHGGYGSDNYRYASGDGDDLIVDWGDDVATDVDALTFVDLDAEDIFAWRDGYDLKLQVIANGDVITVEGQWLGGGNAIERIYFSDSEVWDRIVIANEAPIRGTSGDDTLFGNSESDGFYEVDSEVFEGGKGADAIYGDVGSDIYLWSKGDGSDFIGEYRVDEDFRARDTLWLRDVTEGDSIVTWGNDGVLNVEVISTGEVITIDSQWPAANGDYGEGIELLKFSDGSLDSEALAAITLHRGTTDADELQGGEKDETFVGREGDDDLYGEAGSDVYQYLEGDGSDRINDTGSAPGDTDILVFTDLTLGDVSFDWSGSDLLIYVGAEEIQVDDQFTGEFNDDEDVAAGLEEIIFSDEATLDRDQILELALLASFDSVELGGAGVDTFTVASGYGYLSGRGGDDILTGGVLDDWLLGGADEDTLLGDDGVDLLDGGTGDDDLQGGDGEDEILAGDGDDQLKGGGGADYLDGGEGADDFLIGLGDGDDYISDWGEALATDRVVLGAGIATGDVTLSRFDDDLVMTIAQMGGPAEVVVSSQFGDGEGIGIEEIAFSDTTVWTRGQIEASILASSQTSGDDLILGYGGDDMLEGGLGNDTIDGRGGNDTYLFDAGDGDDIIDDSFGIEDALVLGSGITVLNTVIEREGSYGVKLTFSGSDSVVIEGQFRGLSWGDEQGVEEIRFADTTVLTKDDLADAILIASSTAGADLIEGFERNDMLAGGAGADTFRFAGDYFGNDTVTDFDPLEDVLEFDAFYDFNDFIGYASQSGSDVVIGAWPGSVTLENTLLGDLTSSNVLFI